MDNVENRLVVLLFSLLGKLALPHPKAANSDIS